jgi:uncharacterized protein YjiS (DUF1127 family)
MPAQLEMKKDVSRRNHAMRNGLHDHMIRTAEARRLQAEAIAKSVHWLWTKARWAFGRLMNGKSRELTAAANGKQISTALGRASVAGAFRPDLLRLARLVRRYILEPHARRRGRRIAIAQLRSLDDRLLADIGVKRSEIEFAVDGMLPRRTDFFPRSIEQSVPAEEARNELPLAA